MLAINSFEVVDVEGEPAVPAVRFIVNPAIINYR